MCPTATPARRAPPRACPCARSGGHDTACGLRRRPSPGPTTPSCPSGTWSLLGVELSEPGSDTTPPPSEPHQRARRLRHRPGCCATSWGSGSCRSAAGSGTPVARRVTMTTCRRWPARRAPTWPCSTPTTTRCCMAGTCPPGSPPCAPTPARPLRRRGRARALDPGVTHLRVPPGLRAARARLRAADRHHPRRRRRRRNELLCRLTADICGREVITGPVEATALGNVLVQALAVGELAGLADLRRVVSAPWRRGATDRGVIDRRRDLRTLCLETDRAGGESRRPGHPSRQSRTIRLTGQSSLHTNRWPGGSPTRATMSRVERALAAFEVETPSWGYGDSGTRFGVFPQPGRPRDVFEKIANAAEVHRLTGTAPAVALHSPWDAVDQLGGLADHLAKLRSARRGGSTPISSRTLRLQAGARSTSNPDARIRRKAIDHLLECVQIATEVGSAAQSLWLRPTAPTMRARTTFERGGDRLQESLGELYAALPDEQELLLEYKFLRARLLLHRHPRLGDRSAALSRASGPRARVLVDLGHHAQGVNVEQDASAILAREARLGGISLNNRKYADDDLIVGFGQPARAVPRLRRARRRRGGGGGRGPFNDRPSHNVEAKVEAMVLSVVNLQESYVKSLLIDRAALAAAQADGDVLRRPRADARRLQHRRAPRSAPRFARSSARPPTPSRRSAHRATRGAWPSSEPPLPRARGCRNECRLPIVATVADQWSQADAARASTTLDEVLLASHRLGADRSVANWGGGNTSSKATEIDFRGDGPRRSCGSRAAARTWPRWAARGLPGCAWTTSCLC